jgi:hypothetical protein
MLGKEPREKWRSRVDLLTMALVALLLSPALLLAADLKFLKTGRGIFQSSSLREKLLISYDTPGVFILSGPAIEIQNFTVENLKDDGFVHTFVRFDRRASRYSSLIVNGGEEYPIGDNLTFTIGSTLRVNIDNTVPYLSVVALPEGNSREKAAVLSLAGLEYVASGSGQRAVQVLETNTRSEYRGLIEPYLVKKEGLFLKGKKAENRQLGITFDLPPNPCLKRNTLFLTDVDLKRIISTRDRAKRLSYIERALGRKDNSRLIQSIYPLRIGTDEILAFDTTSGELRVIRNIKSKELPIQVCTIADAAL